MFKVESDHQSWTDSSDTRVHSQCYAGVVGFIIIVHARRPTFMQNLSRDTLQRCFIVLFSNKTAKVSTQSHDLRLLQNTSLNYCYYYNNNARHTLDNAKRNATEVRANMRTRQPHSQHSCSLCTNSEMTLRIESIILHHGCACTVIKMWRNLWLCKAKVQRNRQI